MPGNSMNRHTTELIDGSFTGEQAKTLLLALLSQKINFHKLRKFSNEERFGTDTGRSAKRIEALNREKDRLSAWLGSLKPGDKISIRCSIKMQLAGK